MGITQNEKGEFVGGFLGTGIPKSSNATCPVCHGTCMVKTYYLDQQPCGNHKCERCGGKGWVTV
jgi:DnaJ-class molecular chaperone